MQLLYQTNLQPGATSQQMNMSKFTFPSLCSHTLPSQTRCGNEHEQSANLFKWGYCSCDPPCAAGLWAAVPFNPSQHNQLEGMTWPPGHVIWMTTCLASLLGRCQLVREGYDPVQNHKKGGVGWFILNTIFVMKLLLEAVLCHVKKKMHMWKRDNILGFFHHVPHF